MKWPEASSVLFVCVCVCDMNVLLKASGKFYNTILTCMTYTDLCPGVKWQIENEKTEVAEMRIRIISYGINNYY